MIVLSLTINQRCDGMARGILIFYVSNMLPRTAALIYHYRFPLEVDVFNQEVLPREGVDKWVYLVREITSFLLTLSLILSVISLFDTLCSETAPAIYWTMVAIVILNSLYFIIPLLLILMLFMCLPCVIIGLRWFYPTPNRGASEAVIEKLPCFRYSTNSQMRVFGGTTIEEADATCTICLQDYSDGIDIRVLCCNHHFHKTCVDEWFRLQGTCPLCVQPISESGEVSAEAGPLDAV
jgi:hypothetical protein